MVVDAAVISIRFLVFMLGLGINVLAVMSAVRTYVLPRAQTVWLTRFVFVAMRYLFDWRLKHVITYEERDRIMAYYAPLSMLMLPVLLLSLIVLGYTAMFWGISSEDMTLREAFTLSGSSLTTLGSSFSGEVPIIILTFSEAGLGMILIALLIGYLPTIYNTFSRREMQVNRLEVRAGSPPSSVEMILRFKRIKILYDQAALDHIWEDWEIWFTELEETHTTFAMLNYFRSPKPNNSWVTAAGTVMDAAALVASTVDIPFSFRSNLTIRAGFIALRSIADFFYIPYNPNPKPDDPISITKEEFYDVYQQLKAGGVPVKDDWEQCWADFAGWRVNYDSNLIRLAALTMAPYAPWISDRSLPRVYLKKMFMKKI